METHKPLQIDREEIVNFRPVKCAIRVNEGPIVGSPVATLPGYGIKLAIDGGRYGELSVGLRIRVAKGRKDSHLHHLQDQDIDWTTIEWSGEVVCTRR